MTSEIPCKEIHSSPKPNGDLIISELQIPELDLCTVLDSAICNALSIKKQKIEEKNSSYYIEYLQSNDIPIVQYSSKLDYDDMMGLIGEIISELHHTHCTKKEPLYIKWRETGTSKSKGLDLVFHENDRVYSIECKHPHESLMKIENKKLTSVVKTINDGLVTHTDERTLEFLARLLKRYLQEKRFLVGSKMNITDVDSKIKIIENLIEKNNFVSEINIVSDKKYENDLEKNNLDTNLDFKKYEFISQSIIVLLILLENIEKISEEMFTKHDTKQE